LSLENKSENDLFQSECHLGGAPEKEIFQTIAKKGQSPMISIFEIGFIFNGLTK
jgi:hypothetical protein